MQVVPPSTDFRLRPIHEEVGFDYAQAILEIHQKLSYEEIAECCGYNSVRSLRYLLDDPEAVPSHRRGEAIWALYIELFGRRPPLQNGKKTADGMTT